MTYLHLYTFVYIYIYLSIYHVCIKQFEQADMAFTSYVYLKGCTEMKVGLVAGTVRDTLWIMAHLNKSFAADEESFN